MFKNTYKTISTLVEIGYLDTNKEVIYNYGFYSLLNYLCGLLTLLISSYICDLGIESIIFFIVFLLIRINAGGFHFKSCRLCTIVSLFIIFIAPFFIKYWQIEKITALIFILFSSIFIYFVSPIDTENRKLSIKAKEKLKKRILFILSINLIISVVFYLNNYNILVMSIFIAYLYCFILLFIGKIYNMRGY